MQERGASKRITAWLLTLGWLADTLGCLKEKQPRWQKSGPRLQVFKLELYKSYCLPSAPLDPQLFIAFSPPGPARALESFHSGGVINT